MCPLLRTLCPLHAPLPHRQKLVPDHAIQELHAVAAEAVGSNDGVLAAAQSKFFAKDGVQNTIEASR